MGLFSRDDGGKCVICGSPKGRAIYKNYVCNECLKKAGMDLLSRYDLLNIDVDSVKSAIQSNMEYESKNNEMQSERKKIFNSSMEVGNRVLIDEKNGLFKTSALDSKIFKFSEIIDIELIDDSSTTMEGHSGSSMIGGSVGGVTALFGGGGKVNIKDVCSSIVVRIGIDYIRPFNLNITFLNKQVEKSSYKYYKALNNAKETITSLKSYMVKFSDNSKLTNDPYQEVKKLKELLDIGAITQEEFDKKKKSLLNL